MITWDINWFLKLLGQVIAHNELRLNEVIKGDPAWMNDRKYIIKVRIKQIKENSYITEQSSTFSDKLSSNEFLIVQ